jgi:hypothetical protein
VKAAAKATVAIRTDASVPSFVMPSCFADASSLAGF